MMTKTPVPARAQFSIERIYTASIDEAWTLWTTKAGIESWWGPEGFDVAVASLDLRPGGELVYVMTATAPEQVAFMNRAGMPLSTEARVIYTEVSAPGRLAYKTLADFVPSVTPYEVATVVDLQATPDGVKVTVTFDAMHDDIWTERARAGHESQMRKLDALLAARSQAEASKLDQGFELVEIEGGLAAVEWGRPSFADIPAFQMAARQRVNAALAERGLAKTGPELAFSRSPEGGALAMAPGVVVDRAFEPVGAVTTQVIPPGRAVHFRLAGPYSELGETWAALYAWASARGLERAGLNWEVYGDPSGPITDLYSLVK